MYVHMHTLTPTPHTQVFIFITKLDLPDIKMKLIKQPVSLEINEINAEPNAYLHRHSILLPNSIRCVICGPSNCGKTNVMISLLLNNNGLKFKNVYLYSKTTFQPKYRFLGEVFKHIPDIQLFLFQDEKDVISPDEALEKSVFIFDDVTCENQNNIRNYFSMGRHKHIDCFYLTQTYSRIPKQLIRDNINFLIVFKQDEVNLRHIYDEHVNSDMSWNHFKSLAYKIWKDAYSCVIINKDCEINKGRYRKSFDMFVKFD